MIPHWISYLTWLLDLTESVSTQIDTKQWNDGPDVCISIQY